MDTEHPLEKWGVKKDLPGFQHVTLAAMEFDIAVTGSSVLFSSVWSDGYSMTTEMGMEELSLHIGELNMIDRALRSRIAMQSDRGLSLLVEIAKGESAARVMGTYVAFDRYTQERILLFGLKNRCPIALALDSATAEGLIDQLRAVARRSRN